MALQASLNSEFTSHGFTATAIVSAAGARPDVLHARLMGEQFRIQDNETLLGIASESIAGVMARGGAGFVTSQKQQQERADRRAKEHNDTAFFLTLLNNGELDSYIAGEIVDGMSDAEVTSLVADIEAETGQSFEDYAQGILGDDMPDRMPWESNIDYQRRVTEDIIEEILDERGQIKPGYANDPIARTVLGHDEYQALLPTINEINRAEPLDAVPSQQAIETVQEIAEDSYQAGFQVSDGVANGELAGESQDVRDEARHDAFIASAEAELDLFGNEAAIDFAAGPGLEGAPDVSGEFVVAAAEPIPESNTPTPALGMAATL